MPENRSPITMTLTNLIKFFGFLSPFLIIFFVLTMSIINGTLFKGLIYLVGVLILSVIIYILKHILRDQQDILHSPFCNIFPSPFTVRNNSQVYDNPAMSASIITFTGIYILFPLLLNNNFHPSFIVAMVVLLGLNGVTEFSDKCSSPSAIILGTLIGCTFAIFYYLLLKITSNEKLVFFSDVESNRMVCKKPNINAQKYKCTIVSKLDY